MQHTIRALLASGKVDTTSKWNSDRTEAGSRNTGLIDVPAARLTLYSRGLYPKEYECLRSRHAIVTATMAVDVAVRIADVVMPPCEGQFFDVAMLDQLGAMVGFLIGRKSGFHNVYQLGWNKNAIVSARQQALAIAE